MKSEFRNPAQIEANRLDMELYRLACSLQVFAEEYRAPDVDHSALQLLRARHAVRSQMHPEDRMATGG